MGCSEGTRQHCSWVCCELWAQDGQSGEMAPIMEGCSSQAQPALGVWLHGAGLKLQAAQSGCSTRLPCDTMPPQLGLPTQQHSPTRLCRQPLEPQPALETDRQTDRQENSCRIPRLCFKIAFWWLLQLSRHGISAHQPFPCAAWRAAGGAEALQRESCLMLSISSGSALAGCREGDQKDAAGLPGGRAAGGLGCPVPRCCWTSQIAAGYPTGCSSCAASSATWPRTAGPGSQAPSHRGRAAGG